MAHPQAITSYHKLSQAITSYHKLSQAITSYHKLSQAITSYHKLSQAITSYHKLSQIDDTIVGSFVQFIQHLFLYMSTLYFSKNIYQ
ncbi:hypothetical protein AK822_04790 [Psychrobacter sp. P11F6]|nr:hypothetical protein AK822_04790 [Psychrobacter sp. P11F6]